MKPSFIVITVALCARVLTASTSQSPSVQDQEKALDSAVIAPTDWDSLKTIKSLEDNCDPQKNSDSCVSSLPKPRTTEEVSGIISASECYNVSKVLAAYKPCYPQIAKVAQASGEVEVLVVVDEAGNVTWAHALTGSPLLQFAAVRAACKWRFEPALCSGEKHKVNRVIAFNFTETK
jgi:TonB family protein